MATTIELLLEADRRGILPPDKKALLDEAKRRGIVGGQQQPAQQPQAQQQAQLTGKQMPVEPMSAIDNAVLAYDRAMTSAGKFLPDWLPSRESVTGFLGGVAKGAASGPVSGLIQKGAQIAGRDDIVQKIAKTAEEGNIVGQLLQPEAILTGRAAANIIGKGANWFDKAARSAATIAPYAAASATSTPSDSAVTDAWQQGLTGAALGGAIPVVGAGLSATGLPQKAGNIISNVLPGGGQRAAVRIAREMGADQTVPALAAASRDQTARQAAAGTGNRQFSALMRIGEEYNPNATGARLDAQAAKRGRVLDKVTPDLKSAVATREADAATNYKNAYAQQVSADPQLAQMASNPFFQRAMSEMGDLAKAEGVTFRSNPTRFLHLVKRGLDKMMAKNAVKPLDTEELREVTKLQGELVNWLGDKNKAYEFARSEFARQSAPVNQARLLNDVAEKLQGVAGRERITPTINALNQGEEALVRGATGFRGNTTIEDVLSPRQTRVVNTIENQLEQKRLSDLLAQEGMPRTRAQFNQDEIPLSFPNLLHRPIALANAALKRAEGYGKEKTLRELALLNLDPRGFAALLSRAQTPWIDDITRDALTRQFAIGAAQATSQ